MKRWYVVQVYAGYENAALKDIQKRIEELGLQEQFGEVLIPEAKIQNLFEPESEGQQLFPGYVLIEMESSPETIQAVNKCVRVMRFLGGKEPVPLSKGEVDRMLSQARGEVAVSTTKAQDKFRIGSEVEILDGPFSGFMGMVDKVDNDNEKLSVMVSIFGRMTPVELGFYQVK